MFHGSNPIIIYIYLYPLAKVSSFCHFLSLISSLNTVRSAHQDPVVTSLKAKCILDFVLQEMSFLKCLSVKCPNTILFIVPFIFLVYFCKKIRIKLIKINLNFQEWLRSGKRDSQAKTMFDEAAKEYIFNFVNSLLIFKIDMS